MSDRMSELVKILNKYAHSYYVLDNPTVSDKEYDALYDELSALEKEQNRVLFDSPTLRVGGEILKGFKKYTHKKRLYSLDKCQNKDELKRWTEKILTERGRIRFTVDYKFDGLSVNLFYSGGVLKTAATRGNGTVGEDVTAQIKTVKTVPLKIPFQGECEIQGEVIMKKSSLIEYNKKNPQDLLKNERNAAAGAVRNLDTKVTAGRKLEVIVYSVGYIDEAEKTTENNAQNGGIVPPNSAKKTTENDEVKSLENDGTIPPNYEEKTVENNIKKPTEKEERNSLFDMENDEKKSTENVENNSKNDGIEPSNDAENAEKKANENDGNNSKNGGIEPPNSTQKTTENGGIEPRIFTTQVGMIEFLKENGFKTAEYFKTAETPDEIVDRISEIEEMREGLDYLIDGAVIKIDDLNIRGELGYTEKFPRFAVAYKFEAQEATTVLRGILWQVSRTGKLNPLAVLEPVELAGVTVSRATLSNFSEIKRKDIKINSRVFVRRSNDVIPEITGIAEHYADSLEVEPPKVCPSCGGELRYDSVFIYCQNQTGCRGVTVSKLAHYASRDAMDVAGLSEKTIETFYDRLNLRTIADLYRLNPEDLAPLDGFKDKKTENIIASIEASKDAELADFIYALGIENVGKKAAKELAAKFGTVEGIRNASREEIEAMKDFGGVTAACVYDFFRNERNIKDVEELFSLGVKPKEFEVKKKAEGIFSGKIVVLTGTLERYKRSQAKEIIEALGGEASDSVTAKVNLVIAGADAGGKLEKAKKLGIEIIDEAEFEKMTQNGENV